MEESKKKYAYYDGGIFRNAVIPETDKTPEVHYSYLPLSIASSAMYQGRINTAAGIVAIPELAKIQCEMVKQCVISWDLKKLQPDGTDGMVNCKDMDELLKVDDYIISAIFDEIRQTPKVRTEQVKN